MIQGISLWVSGLCAASLVVAIISAVAPKNSAGRVCVMMASVLVLVALVSPILSSGGISVLDTGRAYERTIRRKIEEAADKTERLKKDIIEEELASYVLNKAGVDREICEVDIEVEDGVVVSAEVKSRDDDATEKVRRVLKDELAISQTRQEIEVG